MKNIEGSRRNFLSKLLTATVLTAACPHIVLGQITPRIKKKGDMILGNYYMNMNEKPFHVLKEIWGSIRIHIPAEFVDGFFAPIVITHLPKEDFNGKEFSCIYTICPHEGRNVRDKDEYDQFVCTGHGSIFDADGKYFDGPAAKDITTYSVVPVSNDRLKIAIPLYFGPEDSVADTKGAKGYYLLQNEPNPCSDTTVLNFGIIMPSRVMIELFSIDGILKMTITDNFYNTGDFSTVVNTSGLPPGAYFLRMSIGTGKPVIRKMIVRH